MYKVRYLFTLLLLLLAISNTKFAGASPPARHSPEIVASVELTGQTTAIPSTTLFTPKTDGLYRISAYMTLTAVGTGNPWNLVLTWTDDAGVETNLSVISLFSDSVPPHAWGGVPAVPPTNPPFIVRANAGQPVSFSTTNINATNGTYELFLTVERLM